MKRIAVRGCGVLLILVAAVWLKVALEARAEVSAGAAAEAKGDREAALTHYRRAVHWTSPFSGSVERALDAMAAMARAAEAAGDRVFALDVWRDVRSSLYAIRHVLIPHEEKLRASEEKIAALVAALPATVTEDRGKPEAVRSSEALAMLRRDNAPSVLWSLVLLAGFGAWIGGVFWFILCAIRDDETLDLRRAAISGATVVIGFAIWIVGLRMI
ncbi:MAG: hypothetical protein HYY84_18380 [Deltaproteobacteria bacterium]|nr:hypothetical protein [Deltaproteobacteria bacterium]